MYTMCQQIFIISHWTLDLQYPACYPGKQDFMGSILDFVKPKYYNQIFTASDQTTKHLGLRVRTGRLLAKTMSLEKEAYFLMHSYLIVNQHVENPDLYVSLEQTMLDLPLDNPSSTLDWPFIKGFFFQMIFLYFLLTLMLFKFVIWLSNCFESSITCESYIDKMYL